jgi:dCTP diphosphatase
MGGKSLDELTAEIVTFRDARDWKQFHHPKDMILSLVLEAAELLELTQWRNGDELERHLAEHATSVGDELADILWWVLLISHDLGLDLEREFVRKVAENGQKYPIERARGTAAKYTEG